MTSRRTVFRADDARGPVNITSTALQISEHDDLERYGVMCLAHHEAGHAVAALNAGARVQRIRIWREGGGLRRPHHHAVAGRDPALVPRRR
uniref:Putative integral membrane protein n=1 Tax=Streptomyces sp. 44030 TaxID=364102 RepID=Q2LEW4_9ACTN|nr:M50 family metallopeptidase [Streptomyces sp. 44030]ABC67351.1 putative integral membrane protein [Streptomyces sp. 44030]